MLFYEGFWAGFDPALGHEHHRFFELLLEGRDATLFSLFAPIRVDAARPGTLRVAYSGEATHLEPTEAFDLNLIMAPTDVARKTVCCPLFVVAAHVFDHWAAFARPRPALALAPAQRRFCAFVVSNGAAEVRTRFFRRLHAAKPVDSCGEALNNCGFKAPRDPAQYLRFLAQYKFVICFENRSLPEYLTEKLSNAYLGGAVPIYWGSTRAVTEWFNPDAFLALAPEATDADMDRLVARVLALDADDAAYEAVRAQPLAPQVPHELRLDTMRARVREVLSNTGISPLAHQ